MIVCPVTLTLPQYFKPLTQLNLKNMVRISNGATNTQVNHYSHHESLAYFDYHRFQAEIRKTFGEFRVNVDQYGKFVYMPSTLDCVPKPSSDDFFLVAWM